MSLEQLCVLRGHTDRVWCCSWHPSGKLLATCSGDKTIRLWGPSPESSSSSSDGPKEWRCLSVLDGVHDRTIRSVSWSPSGKLLASAGFDGVAAVWAREDDQPDADFECVSTLEGHENEVKSVAWDCAGALLASSSRDKSVWIWEMDDDTCDFECLSVLHGHTQDVKAVRWHPDKELLFSVSYDDTICVWKGDDDDWFKIDTLQGHESTVWDLTFDPADSSRFVTVSDDLSIIAWQNTPSRANPEQGTWTQLAHKANAHQRTIYSCDWSSSTGLIATGAADDCIKFFRIEDSNEIAEVGCVEHAHNADVNCVAWKPNQAVLATCGDDFLVKIWKFTPP